MELSAHHWQILLHLTAALVAGGVIGLERSYHGRPAGFRTHTLVCTASALLMLLAVYQVELLPQLPIESVRVDPTRMGQGIMTGIGFLGAGVIMKEGLTIRGLTTAASIWITAAIGILIGVGFYFPAVVGTLMTLLVLSVFRRVEAVMPNLSYAHLTVRFLRRDYLPQEQLADAITQCSVTSSDLTYRLTEDGKYFEYEMTVRSLQPDNFQQLAELLAKRERVLAFSITPAGK